MAGAASYSVYSKFIGVDLVTEVATKVGKAYVRLLAPVKALNSAIEKPSYGCRSAGSARWQTRSPGKFRGGLSHISSWLPALGAIGTAASFGGLIELSRKASESFEGIRLGVGKTRHSDQAAFRLALRGEAERPSTAS